LGGTLANLQTDSLFLDHTGEKLLRMVVWIGGFDASLSMPSDDQVSKKPKLQANLLPGIASVMKGWQVLAMRTLRADLRAFHFISFVCLSSTFSYFCACLNLEFT
jgi:hypothetical protein